MPARALGRAFVTGPARWSYARSAGGLRWLCRREWGRSAVRGVMRTGAWLLLWAFQGRRQASPGAVNQEWQRILRGLGLEPQGAGCCSRFGRCTLALGPGDGATCDSVMAINDTLIRKLGGKMVIEQRLTDAGADHCRVRIAPKPAREVPVWYDEPTALLHFDAI